MAERSFPARLATERLILRQWQDTDAAPLAALNADPDAMHYFANTRSRAESDALLGRFRESWRKNGFSYMAVEEMGGGFVGFVGLHITDFPVHLAPCVEVGWRLVREAWGKGYATEAARACLAQGFGEMGLDEVVAMSVAANARSRAVMARLGMTRDPADDFDDPDEAVDSPLRALVLYRLRKADWKP